MNKEDKKTIFIVVIFSIIIAVSCSWYFYYGNNWNWNNGSCPNDGLAYEQTQENLYICEKCGLTVFHKDK